MQGSMSARRGECFYEGSPTRSPRSRTPAPLNLRPAGKPDEPKFDVLRDLGNHHWRAADDDGLIGFVAEAPSSEHRDALSGCRCRAWSRRMGAHDATPAVA